MRAAQPGRVLHAPAPACEPVNTQPVLTRHTHTPPLPSLPAGPSMSTAACCISTTITQLLMRLQPGSRQDLTFH